MIKVRIKLLTKSSVLPVRKSDDAAGWDVFSITDVCIPGGCSFLVPVGIAMEMPPDLWCEVRSRSGLAIKKDIEAFHGTIDADYRGEIKVKLRNYGTEAQTIKAGDRVAQLVFHRLPLVDLIEADTLSVTPRGEGGFGSTGE